MKSDSKENAFLKAILHQTRLVSEQITTAPAKPGTGTIELKVRTQTSSSFAVALDEVTNPKNFIVEIDYKAYVKILDTEKLLAQYEAKHAAQFTIIKWAGFDWPDVPDDVIAPYFAMLQNIAIRRADTSFVEMMMRGVVLPPAAFDKPPTSKEKVDIPTPAK